MFGELLRHEGVVEVCELRSPFGFMAFHGGSLERVTDEIAAEASARAGASYYAVLQPPDLRWHVPSRLVSPSQSEALAEFLDHAQATVAVHGYGRRDHFTTLLLGGRNRALASHLAAHLRPSLPHYDVVDDLDHIPEALRGQHPDNPVNHPGTPGVQLELPPRVRGLGPYWADADDGARAPHTEALIDALATAAGSWEG